MVERLFNRDGWEAAGGGSAVNATSWDAAEGYEVTSAPSMRMVVSLADFDDSRWVSLTGVSGHPFSDHYTDQTDLWAEGEVPGLAVLGGRGRGGRKRTPSPWCRPTSRALLAQPQNRTMRVGRGGRRDGAVVGFDRVRRRRPPRRTAERR